MKSQTRLDCESSITEFCSLIADPINLLYVGVAGDSSPKGEYSYLFRNSNITSVDVDPKWNPDVVCDITNPYSKLTPNTWDLILMVQVIEHIPNIFSLSKSLEWLLSEEGYLIIDCPWQYPYHPEPPSFGDFWRVSKDGFRVLFSNLKEIKIIQTNNNTSCLFQKIQVL